jgi:hypothetical protein
MLARTTYPARNPAEKMADARRTSTVISFIGIHLAVGCSGLGHVGQCQEIVRGLPDLLLSRANVLLQ